MQDADDKRLITTLRIISFICGLALIILALKDFITSSISGPREFILNIYYILFGILTCFSEMPCESLTTCFVFLKFYIGKSIFYLFLATITFDYKNTYFLIVSILLFFSSIMYLIIFCNYKEKDIAQEPNTPSSRKEDQYQSV
jgi:COPI associated protein